VCVLERGREWIAGDFPHRLSRTLRSVRTRRNPGGLFDVHPGKELDVVVGSGLGGTSLINAGGMVRPRPSSLTNGHWPKGIPDLSPYYERVARALHIAVNPSPPPKTEALALAVSRSPNIGEFAYVPVAITFLDAHRREEGVVQTACNGCGNCLLGCNETSKNTLDMNYLALAERRGASLFTMIEVQAIEDRGAAGFRVHFTDHATGRDGTVAAGRVILSAGTLGSFSILASSRLRFGLRISDALGARFSANGDAVGLCYNTIVKAPPAKGPTCGSSVMGRSSSGANGCFALMEGGAPPATLFLLRNVMALAGPFGKSSAGKRGGVSLIDRATRALADLLFMPSRGALNRSLALMANAFEDGHGELVLKDGGAVVSWPGVKNDGFWERATAPMREICRTLGGVFLTIPKWTNPGTVHPLGGCVMADDARRGVVNARGEVFGYEGRLYVMDGSVIPGALGVGPAFTVAALTEYFCDMLIDGDRRL
jgi:cholesterol oxidase